MEIIGNILIVIFVGVNRTRFLSLFIDQINFEFHIIYYKVCFNILVIFDKNSFET